MLRIFSNILLILLLFSILYTFLTASADTSMRMLFLAMLSMVFILLIYSIYAVTTISSEVV
ncbi:MAG: hypothetical protein N3G77_00030 [Nitrososphaeria archaeon]|nr:hypothetical protein [Nitrososphaeria archaeon]MDW7986204.1 hypothetical protein [Nitrososphaerota archaeon]